MRARPCRSRFPVYWLRHRRRLSASPPVESGIPAAAPDHSSLAPPCTRPPRTVPAAYCTEQLSDAVARFDPHIKQRLHVREQAAEQAWEGCSRLRGSVDCRRPVMNQTATVSHQVKCQSTKTIKVRLPQPLRRALINFCCSWQLCISSELGCRLLECALTHSAPEPKRLPRGAPELQSAPVFV